MKTVYKSDIVTRSSIIWCRSNFSAWDEKWKSLNQAVSNEAICNWNVRPCLQTRRKIVAQSLWCKSHFLAAIQLFKVFVIMKRGSLFMPCVWEARIGWGLCTCGLSGPGYGLCLHEGDLLFQLMPFLFQSFCSSLVYGILKYLFPQFRQANDPIVSWKYFQKYRRMGYKICLTW